MRQRAVVFSPEARNDLVTLYDWIADAASPQIALNYIERLENYCMGLSHASERGQRRDDVRRNLRIVGFERRATIAFSVTAEQVTVLRVYYAGRNWTDKLE